MQFSLPFKHGWEPINFFYLSSSYTSVIFPAGTDAESNFLVYIISNSSHLGLSFNCCRYFHFFRESLRLFTSCNASRYHILFDSSGVPLSKPLYTLSYMFVTAGASGVVLTTIYFIVSFCCEVVICLSYAPCLCHNHYSHSSSTLRCR